jgi:acetyltransferase-like isoleucine patch superfamily enzyme
MLTISNPNAFSNIVLLCDIGEISNGAYFGLGDQVVIYECAFCEVRRHHRNRNDGHVLSVVIGNNVWLDSRVMVLNGVTSGDNTVVVAGAVVTKSLPVNVIAARIPANVIRKLSL